MTNQNSETNLFLSAVKYLAMSGEDKKIFYEEHINKGINIPFIYHLTNEKYLDISLNDRRYCLVNFNFLVLCLYWEYKTAVDLEFDIRDVSSAIELLNAVINEFIFDEQNIIDDNYILNNKGVLNNLRQAANSLLNVMKITNDKSGYLLNINEIVGIYNYVASPEIWNILSKE